MNSNIRNLKELSADCKNCFGLCCIALHFSASEGFPNDKDAGKPCINLQNDFRCAVHGNLNKLGLKGCIAYDCFGAGQKVSQFTYGGISWLEDTNTANEIFEVFIIMRQLHELLWYISEALTIKVPQPLHENLESIWKETKELTLQTPGAILNLDLISHGAKVNALLIKVSELTRVVAFANGEADKGKPSFNSKKMLGQGADLIGKDLKGINLIGANLRGAYLIAADLRGVDLRGADLIGADFRDTNISGADLSESIFLTQSQVNVAKGDQNTKLPPHLTYPRHWISEPID